MGQQDLEEIRPGTRDACSGRVRAVVFLAAVVCTAVLVSGCSQGSGAVDQPIAFDHKKHTQELELDCTTCHRYVREAAFAGRPKAEVCAECHEEAMTDSPEEQKLLEYISSGREIPWRRLYKVPDHVYYSHRRHVVVAGLQCAECHGRIAQTEKPPRKPLRKFTMKFCLKCHEKRGASTDCSACHK